MRYCPSCQSNYADDQLRFCLQDGTGLLDYAIDAPAPTVAFSETETVVRQKPDTFAWQPRRITQEDARLGPNTKKSGVIPAVVVTVIVMCLFFGGIFAAWKMLGGRVSDNSNIRVNTPAPTITPTINKTPSTPNVNDLWHPTDYNASLTGENLTYYRGTTPEQCKADCGKNLDCRGFGLIRAGFYNPGDPPMCYLLSEVTGSTPSPCCISAIKK